MFLFSQHALCCWWMLLAEASRTHAFAARHESKTNVYRWMDTTTTTTLFALGRAQTKQAELARKLALAKRQQQQQQQQQQRGPLSDGDDDVNNNTPQQQPNDEMKQRRTMEQERAEFAHLLANHRPPPAPREATFTPAQNNPVGPVVNRPTKPKVSVKRPKKESSSEEHDAVESSESHQRQPGDVAQRRHFETLVSLRTKQPLGPMAAARLVPWVPPYESNYLVVLADPRPQSPALRQSVGYLIASVAPNVVSQIIAVTADSAEETTAWLRRVGMEGSCPIRIFSDPKLEWMKTYSADQGRWSLSLYAFDTDGVIQSLHREVDPSQASRLLSEMVQSIEEKMNK